MNSSKEGKEWALILGGSSGLGLATAKKLARHGYNIIVIHRNRRLDMPEIEINFQEIAGSGIKFKSFNADAIQPEKRTEIMNEISNMLSETDKIKVLVHSIAKGNLKVMSNAKEGALSSQDFKTTLNAMALSLYDWTQGLLQAQLFSEDTRVISFTSEGNTRVLAGYGAVSAAKATLEAITRNMAVELAPYGIKANCIQAGATETAAFKMILNSDKIKEYALRRNPNGRLTQPEDVANVVYLLCTEEAKWITGTVIKVDGGESLS